MVCLAADPTLSPEDIAKEVASRITKIREFEKEWNEKFDGLQFEKILEA